MAETLHCPGCQAQLMLPVLPPSDQSVQCPRCQRVFEPTWRSSAVPATAGESAYGVVPRQDDHELFEVPRRLGAAWMRSWGNWFPHVSQC